MKHVQAIAHTTLSGFVRHHIMRHAAALAYAALFATAPVMLLVLVGIGAFLGADSAQSELHARIAGLAGSTFAGEALRIAAGAHRTGFVSVSLGVILALAGTVGIVVQFEAAMDEILEDGARTALGIWAEIRRRAMAAGALIALIASVIVLIVADVVLTRFRVGGAIHAIEIAGGILFLLAFFTIVRRLVPENRPSWRQSIVSGTVITVLVVVGQAAVMLYLHFANFSTVYGAAGSVIVLLVWLYYTCAATLIGTELARGIEIASGRGPRPARKPGPKAARKTVRKPARKPARKAAGN